MSVDHVWSAALFNVDHYYAVFRLVSGAYILLARRFAGGTRWMAGAAVVVLMLPWASVVCRDGVASLFRASAAAVALSYADVKLTPR
jgi:hypothetical protein